MKVIVVGKVVVRRDGLEFIIACPGSVFRVAQALADPWWHNIYYPLDNQRGQDDHEDYFLPGYFEAPVDPAGETQITVTLALGSEPADAKHGDGKIGNRT